MRTNQELFQYSIQIEGKLCLSIGQKLCLPQLSSIFKLFGYGICKLEIEHIIYCLTISFLEKYISTFKK